MVDEYGKVCLRGDWVAYARRKNEGIRIRGCREVSRLGWRGCGMKGCQDSVCVDVGRKGR